MYIGRNLYVKYLKANTHHAACNVLYSYMVIHATFRSRTYCAFFPFSDKFPSKSRVESSRKRITERKSTCACLAQLNVQSMWIVNDVETISLPKECQIYNCNKIRIYLWTEKHLKKTTRIKWIRNKSNAQKHCEMNSIYRFKLICSTRRKNEWTK